MIDSKPVQYLWGALRLAIGWTFLWPFLDKMFGLGFATCRDVDTGTIDFACDAAMIKGGSPTYGFLAFGTQGSHTGFLFDWMAPSAPDSINLADIGFMVGLLLIGLALVLGVAVKLGGLGGVLMLTFMYLASAVWPANNPFMDDHIVAALVCVGFILVPAGRYLGFGRQWEQISAVRRTTWLQ